MLRNKLMRGKRGQMGLAILGSIFCLLVGLLLANFLMPEVTTFRNDMNCATPAVLHDGAKLLRLMADATVIYWIVIVLSLVIGGVTYYFNI